MGCTLELSRIDNYQVAGLDEEMRLSWKSKCAGEISILIGQKDSFSNKAAPSVVQGYIDAFALIWYYKNKVEELLCTEPKQWFKSVRALLGMEGDKRYGVSGL